MLSLAWVTTSPASAPILFILGSGLVRLAVRLIPPEVMADARRRTVSLVTQCSAARYLVAGLIVLVWLAVLFLIGRALWGWLYSNLT